jgi:N-formylglutamate amidohydrolase
VYLSPDEAWGINLWQEPPDSATIEESLREYDHVYATVEKLLQALVEEYGRVVVYDLHSYNFRRQGVDAPAATHPEVNVGTGTMNRAFWSPVVDEFIRQLRACDFQGRSLDVRENVKFQGGHFGRWIHQTFPTSVCALAIEFKKFFMDEHTGEADLLQVEAIYRALHNTVPGVRAALERVSLT